MAHNNFVNERNTYILYNFLYNCFSNFKPLHKLE
jgi:hypothetical protein